MPLDHIKVNLDKIQPQKIPSSDRDVYTCLSLMRDTSSIGTFLLKLN